MFERLAITTVGVTATVVLTVGLVAAGFLPSQGETDASGALIDQAVLAAQASAQASSAAPSVEPKVVYVKPAPPRKTVVVQRQSSVQGSTAAGSSASRAVRPTRTYEHEDRYERQDREGHEAYDD
jgi:hypothetical protein